MKTTAVKKSLAGKKSSKKQKTKIKHLQNNGKQSVKTKETKESKKSKKGANLPMNHTSQSTCEDIESPPKDTTPKKGKRLTRVSLLKGILSVRKPVKQARVLTVNRLTRNIQMLEKKQANEKQRAQLQKKVQRFKEEISILKGLTRDEVARFALSEARNPEAVVASNNSTLHERACARLAQQPPVAERVRKFRQRYPTWQKDVPKLLPKIKPPKSKSVTSDGRKTVAADEDDSEGEMEEDGDSSDEAGEEEEDHFAGEREGVESDDEDSCEEEMVNGKSTQKVKTSPSAKKAKDAMGTIQPEDASSSSGEESDDEDNNSEMGENVAANVNSLGSKRYVQSAGSENGEDSEEDSDEQVTENAELRNRTLTANGDADSDEEDSEVEDEDEMEAEQEDDSETPDTDEVDDSIAAKLLHDRPAVKPKKANVTKDDGDETDDEDEESEEEEMEEEGSVDEELSDEEEDDVGEDEEQSDEDALPSPSLKRKPNTKIPVDKSKGEMKIKRLKLDPAVEEDQISLGDEDESSAEEEDEVVGANKRSSFFVGGEDDSDENGDEDQDDEDDEDEATEDVLMDGRRRLIQREQIRRGAEGGPSSGQKRWQGAERGHRGRFSAGRGRGDRGGFGGGRGRGWPDRGGFSGGRGRGRSDRGRRGGGRGRGRGFSDENSTPVGSRSEDAEGSAKDKMLRPEYLDKDPVDVPAGADRGGFRGRGDGGRRPFRGRGDRGRGGGFGDRGRGFGGRGRGFGDRGGGFGGRGRGFGERGRGRGGSDRGRGGFRGGRGGDRGGRGGFSDRGGRGGFSPRGGRGGDRGGGDRGGRGGFRGGRGGGKDGMHPSWSAKKSQTPTISKFEGKKTTFD